MKLLIIAGPYEADRIRRAAVSAGFEAVAVEPGESLSGWITATRPDVIIVAPQIVNADPEVALAKIRTVPRGRVPTFVVGDAEDRAALEGLADGFFVRPVAAEDLLARAFDASARATPRSGEDPGSGPHGAAGASVAEPTPAAVAGTAPAKVTRTGAWPRPTPLKPLIAARQPEVQPVRQPEEHPAKVGGRVTAPMQIPGFTSPVPHGLIPAPAPADVSDPVVASRVPALLPPPGGGSSTLFDSLAQTIDADFDAEIVEVVRSVGVLRRNRPPLAAPAAAEATEPPGDEAVDELKDESSQKTLEVPQGMAAALAGGDDGQSPQASPSSLASSGDEVDLDLPSLLARMYLSRLSGRLTLRHGDVRKHIVFERGHPVLAGSTRSEDRMGELLVRQGRCTPEQIAACGAEGMASGRRLGAVLVDRGLVKATELSPLVRRHHEEIIYSLFTWDRGAWNLGTDASAAAEKVLLSRHPASLILEGIRRKFSAERALAGLGGAGRVLRLRLTTGASDLLEKMELTAEERNLVLLFDGVRSLTEIRALTGAAPERLCGVAWALTVLERLDVVDAQPRGTSVPTARDRPGPAHVRNAVIDRALVQSRHALVVEGDYFQILGVARDCSAQEIKRAHEVLASEFAREALHPSIVVEWKAQLAEIRDVIDEAARLLSDDQLRRQYCEHLPPQANNTAATPDAPRFDGRAP